MYVCVYVCMCVYVCVSNAGDACSEENYSSSRNLFCLLNLPEFGWGLRLNLFQKCPTFSQVLLHLFSAGHGLLECGWLNSTPSAYVVAYISHKFLFGFRKVLLKLNPTSSFTVIGLLHDDELAKALD